MAGEPWFVPLSAILLTTGATVEPLRDGSFESADASAEWVFFAGDRKAGPATVSLDGKVMKDGKQSVLITADRPAKASLHQEIYLPVGSLWRLAAWVKAEVTSGGDTGPSLYVSTPIGAQGSAVLPSGER